MAEWQPDHQNLRTLASCLKDSLSGFNKAAQKQAEHMLNQAKSSPDFNNYLALLFSSEAPPADLSLNENDYHLVRSAAALMLKNNIRAGTQNIPENSLALIKLAVPIGLQDKNSQIRSYAGNIATELLKQVGVYGWPELLPDLLKMIGNEGGQYTAAAQEGAISPWPRYVRIMQRHWSGRSTANDLSTIFFPSSSKPPKTSCQRFVHRH